MCEVKSFSPYYNTIIHRTSRAYFIRRIKHFDKRQEIDKILGNRKRSNILLKFSNNTITECASHSFHDVLIKNRAKMWRRLHSKARKYTHPLHIDKVDVELRSLRSTHLLCHVLQEKFVISLKSTIYNQYMNLDTFRRCYIS